MRSIISAHRLRKLVVIIKECLLSAQYAFCRNSRDFEDVAADPPVQKWEVTSQRRIDQHFFQLSTVGNVRDTLAEDGQINARHQYAIRSLIGATSYTNESTHRSIFDRNDKLVDSLSYQRANSIIKAPSSRRLSITKKFPGVTANLYGNVASAEGNYLHWFVDSLSRLFLMERYYALDEIDFVLVPPLKYDFHWESLHTLGIDRTRVIELGPLECYEFEKLIASSPPRGVGTALCPLWIIERYRTLFLDKSQNTKSSAGKRVYITRRDAPQRMFLNENEVCDFFSDQGYDVVELTPLNLLQKIAVFRDADVIVSQTGAGLTNAMYCKPSVKLLELVDSNFVYPLYASLAVHNGGQHRAHLFKSKSDERQASAMVGKSFLDIKRLRAEMDKFGI